MFVGLQRVGDWLLRLGREEDSFLRSALVRTLVDDAWLALSTIALTQIGWAVVIATTGNPLFLLFMPIDLALWVGRRRLRHRIALPRSAEIETAGATLAVLNVGWSVLVATQVILLLQAGNLRALVLGMMLSVGERSYTSTLYAGFPRLTRACAAISTLAQMIGLWLAFNPQLVPMVPMAVALSLAFLLLGGRAHATLLEAVKARQIAHRQSRLDPLTGLGNRLAKLERLKAICEAAGAGSGSAVSFISISMGSSS